VLDIQKKYINYLNQVLEKVENTDIYNSNFITLKEQIEKKELIVPVVGGFSAGKSTLINQFLEESILSMSITPETALATELRYSENSYIEAIKKDDSIDRYEVSDSEKLKEKAEKYKYVRFYLNNQKLKSIEPLILVDMPGFDAPIEHHNQAILNYLNKGIYFIVLTSVEDGNITKSMTREISNIMEFGKDFSFCLSKTNLKPQNEIIEIKNKIQEQLEDYFDFNKEVILTTNKDGEELGKILKSINIEELFNKIFLEELKYGYMDIESSINTIVSTLKISKEDAQNVINELKNSIKNILNKKTQLIEETEEKYSNSNIDGIINQVGIELNNQKDLLVSLAISNQDTFSRELNDIVKHTIIREIKNRIKNISEDIVDNFSFELKNSMIDIKDFDFDSKWIEKIGASTKDLLEKAQNGLNSVLDNRQKNGTDDKLFKTITAILGLTTTVLNPIVEIVIFFLPEIISFLTGKSKEEKQKELVLQKISSEVIPNIKRKIRDSIPEVFNSYLKNTIELISNEFEVQLAQKQNEIELTQSEKENNIKDIEQELIKLENIKKELQNLTTQSLYN
jgi:hypothetical protein